MISVIITTHNRHDRLRKAVKSVLEQSYQDFEIIIVDDASTDDTPKLIKHYEDNDKRIRGIYRKENFGTHTRPKNEGTKEAKGDYIAYLDDDNTYRKDHLQALWNEIKDGKYDVVYGDRMQIDESGKTPPIPMGKTEFSLHELSQRPFIDTSDVLCKKQAIFDVGGWDESLSYYADYNLWVRMAKAGKQFKRVPLIITDYYVHGKNNVNKSQKKYKELIDKGISPEDPIFLDLLNGFSIQGCKLWPDKTLFGKRPKLKVAVYTLTYNRLKYTQETFDSMRQTTKYPFDHYVLDQGSKDNTWKWLCDKEKEYNLKIYTENTNLGISRGSNYLLDKIGYEYDVVIKVDNDLMFISDGWLEAIVDVFERTNGVVVSPYIEGLIDHPGGYPRIKDGYIDKNYVGIVQHLGGACIAASTDIYKSFRWKENDFLHGEQDWIFSQQVLKSGRVLCYLENIRVEHMFNTSPSAKHADELDREYFEKRKMEKVTRYEP